MDIFDSVAHFLLYLDDVENRAKLLGKPSKRGAKLGNYGWAGVKCDCKE